jgi:transcriptional regulator with XRE-family HTH domain
MSTFAERMKELRLEKGLKKIDVANGTNLSRSTITKYEEGSRDNPTLPILIKLADFFNVSVDYIAGNTDIREQGINSSNLIEIFSKLNDNHKIELIKYAKYLLSEQE